MTKTITYLPAETASAVTKPQTRTEYQYAKQRTHLDAWREDNTEFVTSWETVAGAVVVFGGWKIYYGRCVVCGCLITSRKDIRGYVGSSMRGRWKENCDPCMETKRATAARGGMRKSRATQKERRAADDRRMSIVLAERQARLPGLLAAREAAERRKNGLPPTP